MLFKKLAVVAAAVGTAVAQRPMNMSVCDYYTTALLMNNTAANQYTLLTLLVNTAVIGNYTTPNVGIKVNGILAAGTYNGTDVNLLPYFDGQLASTNQGGSSGVSSNFLDGGGAAPLMMSMPANDTMSNQYFLLTHLYQFFGALLGCSQYGMGAFPAYGGDASMYSVHEFMDLNPYQVGYFIEQVALSGASFGVAASDLMAVGTALNSLFGYRCSPAMTVIPAQGPQLQAICVDGSCPISPNATCASYNATMMPVNTTSNATVTSPGSSGTASAGGSSGGSSSGGSSGGSSATMSAGTAASTGGAATVAGGLSFAAVAGGFAALLL